MSRKFTAAQSTDLQAAGTVLANGAILIDEFDDLIRDDVYREFSAWDRIDKRPAPGETTGGFDQTGVATARAVNRRSINFSTGSVTRVARTRREIRAIVANLSFGIFDRSVYQQQGRRFGDLEAKDVADMKTSCLRHWSSLFYVGDESGSGNLEFDGLGVLCGSGEPVAATASVVDAIVDKITDMINNSDRAVRPTAIYTNARVVNIISKELLASGDRLLYAPIMVGGSVYQVGQLATPVGFLPVIADPFNVPVLGTPNVYPTYIVSENMLSYQYVAPLGEGNGEPVTFDLSMANTLETQYVTIMFGAIEPGPLDEDGLPLHHARLNISDRTTVVPPAGTSA